jgi:hypothetical protein
MMENLDAQKAEEVQNVKHQEIVPVSVLLVLLVLALQNGL